jgi:hypothetical protein
MKTFNFYHFLIPVFSFVLFSCQKQTMPDQQEIPQEVVSKIKALGFSTSAIQSIDEGFLVEGDIILTNEQLDQLPSGPTLLIAKEEQYRTTNLVTGIPRTITISMDSKLSSTAGYTLALNEMVARYNALGLGITFQVVTSQGKIALKNASGSYLASAGFPTSTGEPFNSVSVNARAIGSGTSASKVANIATILAHEVGHCIGFRHTDYMNRAFSCGSGGNEGASTVGAVHIPGTPTGPDAGSWMLACIGSGQNRPFNTNDKTALSYLY